MNNTIDYYNNNADRFIENTVNSNMETVYNVFLKYVIPNGKILDLGCGSGRDSKEFIKRGYSVVASDGSQEMCKRASDYIGQEVECNLFNEIEYKDEFDGVWACATLLHLPQDVLPDVIARISKALKDNAYFYLSFKYGEFSGERNGRFFTDMNEETFQELIRKYSEFEIIETMITEDVRPDRENEKWFNVVLRKSEIHKKGI